MIEVITKFQKWTPDLEGAKQIGLYNTGQGAVRQARENAPYNTGKLRQAISVEPGIVVRGTKEITVGPRKLAYAIVREFVNKKNPHTRFYMRRTSEVVDKIAEKEFAKALIIAFNKK